MSAARRSTRQRPVKKIDVEEEAEVPIEKSATIRPQKSQSVKKHKLDSLLVNLKALGAAQSGARKASVLASIEHHEETSSASASAVSVPRESSEDEQASRLIDLAGTPEESVSSVSRETSYHSAAEELPPTKGTRKSNKGHFGHPDRKPTKVEAIVYDVPDECPACDMTSFDDVASFRAHMTENHSTEYTLCKYETCARAIQKAKKLINERMALAHHYKNDHDDFVYRCTEDPNCNFKPTLDKEVYEKHIQRHKLSCSICLKERGRALPFANKKNLDAHMAKEHSAEAFVCPIYDPTKGEPCGRKFADKKTRNHHISMVHKGECICTPCSDSGITDCMFENELELARHMKKEHPDEIADWADFLNAHVCKECGKSFSSAGNRAAHVRSVHKKEKPFACNATVLNKSVSQAMEDDEGNPLEWDHEVDGCDKAYGSKMGLIDHVRIVHFNLTRWQLARKYKDGSYAEQKIKRLKGKKRAEPSIANMANILTGAQDPDVKEEDEIDNEDDDDELQQPPIWLDGTFTLEMLTGVRPPASTHVDTEEDESDEESDLEPQRPLKRTKRSTN